MSDKILAVFHDGVFRPLEPVELAEGARVVVQLDVPASVESDEVDEETRQAWSNYLERMESLPDHSSRDGLSNRDHDRNIYGA